MHAVLRKMLDESANCVCGRLLLPLEALIAVIGGCRRPLIIVSRSSASIIFVAALLALAGERVSGYQNGRADECYDGNGKSSKIAATERWMSGLSRTPGKRV
jgi:hypothetical protein